MKHLIVCREYPPAPYPPGGIGTYTSYISELLVAAGETVHVLAQRWEGAPARVEESHGGHLVVHRVSVNDYTRSGHSDSGDDRKILHGLMESDCPAEAFSWLTARAAESLILSEGIDLVEAPEWEAPLYYLQLRRRLGLGVDRHPPCVVHLHSPSALIFQHNDWNPNFSDYQRLRQLEAFSVAAADALVCPSAYLARQAAGLFGGEPVEVIPYPAPSTPQTERPPDVWRSDAICYVGRLELRKGILEWIQAAVQVAHSHPRAEFHFVGSDTSLDGGPGRSVRSHVLDQIPRSLRSRFHFKGSMPRHELTAYLAQFPAAAVPSRWDNLPYTCIEAMCSGIPVLATATGGMAELITDGESGWVSPRPTPTDLAEALQRFLATPPEARERMGRTAAEVVRRICSREEVVRHHIDWRRRVVQAASSRSANAGSATARAGAVSTSANSTGARVTGIARTIPLPALTVEEDDRPGGLQTERATRLEALQASISRVLRDDPRVATILFVRGGVSVAPEFLDICEALFRSRPEIGLIAPFAAGDGAGTSMETGPGWTAEWSLDDLDRFPCAAVRVDALVRSAASGVRGIAVTYPEMLAVREGASVRNGSSRQAAPKRYSVMTLAQRGSARLTIEWFLAAPMGEKLTCAARFMLEPRRAARWVAWQLRAMTEKAI
jgi:glycosyltransferase involved in cell wall biosynthesis